MDISKRKFLQISGAAAAFTLALTPKLGLSASSYFSDKIFQALDKPKLPYSDDALEPYISSKTISYHFYKHHLGYYNKLLKQIAGTNYEGLDLSNIILSSAGRDSRVFNKAAQVWNHTFYWHSMKQNGGGKIEDLTLLTRVIEDFGSQENLEKEFKNIAAKHFGSGWAWLVMNEEQKFELIVTKNAELPQTQNLIPMLTIDLWEHAYYLDYQNARGVYLDNFFKYLVNWKFINYNFITAKNIYPKIAA